MNAVFSFGILGLDSRNIIDGKQIIQYEILMIENITKISFTGIGQVKVTITNFNFRKSLQTLTIF